MALPGKIQVNAITGASQPSTIDNDINNLKQALVDNFGIPDKPNVSAAVMTVNASGLDNVIFRNTAGDPDTAGELQRNSTLLKFHNGSAVRTLATLEGAQTFTSSMTINGDLSFAAGGEATLGTSDAEDLTFKTSNNDRYTIKADGRHLFGTSQGTGAAAGDMVLANGKAYRWVNAAGSTSTQFGLTGNSSNAMLFEVPASTNEFIFTFAGNGVLRMVNQNGGGGVKFSSESSADHTAPASDGAILYTKDNGAGKTQLCVRFATGAVQVIATQP